MSKLNVVIIGAGQIGTALAHAIADRGEIEFWDKNPASVPHVMKSLEELIPNAQVVFLCIPSWVTREVAKQITPLLSKETIVVALAKGLEADSLKTIPTVLTESLPDLQPFALLGGPLLAEEIRKDLPSFGVFGSVYESAFQTVNVLFEHSCIRIEYADDPESVALASVLKNVYAVGLGIAEGLAMGWNAKGWLARIAIQEMRNIGEALGGKKEIIGGTAGAGDFLATSMSPDSHNHETGRKIGQTGKCDGSSEGCRSLTSVLTLLKDQTKFFPFLLSLERIIIKHEAPQAVFQDLFTTK